MLQEAPAAGPHAHPKTHWGNILCIQTKEKCTSQDVQREHGIVSHKMFVFSKEVKATDNTALRDGPGATQGVGGLLGMQPCLENLLPLPSPCVSQDPGRIPHPRKHFWIFRNLSEVR